MIASEDSAGAARRSAVERMWEAPKVLKTVLLGLALACAGLFPVSSDLGGPGSGRAEAVHTPTEALAESPDAGYQAPGGTPPDTGNPHPPSAMDAFAEMEVLDGFIRSSGLDEFDRLAGFANWSTDAGTRTITVFWKGAVPEKLKTIARAAPEGISVRIVEAKHSGKEIESAAQRLVKGIGRERISSVGELPGNGGLIANMPPSGAASWFRTPPGRTRPNPKPRPPPGSSNRVEQPGRATGSSQRVESMPSINAEILFDRPFAHAIADTATGLPLILGQVDDPAAPRG
jgi:hypothetical protein